MASTRLGYLALKKEATKATALKPTNFVRFKEGDIGFNQEIIEANPIMNNRWNPLIAVPGKISTDANFKMDVEAKEVWHFLYAALGSYSKTVLSGTATKHTFWVANDLPTYTIEQLKGNPNWTDYEVIRAYGAMVDSFELSGSDGICEMNVKIKAHGVFVKSDLTVDSAIWSPATLNLTDTRGLVSGDNIKITDSTETEDTTITAVSSQTTITATTTKTFEVAKGAKVELRPQTPSYSAQALPYSFVHASFKFGANLTAADLAAETNVENWTFSFENWLEERYWSMSATPSVIAPKGAKAKLKFTKYFENSADRDAYLNLTKQAVILTLDLWKNIWNTTYNYKLKISIADIRFTSYEMPTGTDDIYAVELEWTCFYDTTEGKAIEIELQNDITDYDL